ncbi:unnamed protein product [Paramecium sonneborni]|uniref:Uncharacterized protein n=1 Tax=Paramecium sonneborni TaxID=65129 RepID=A0A8S1RJ62_9CILI|nr:unnamed protein product [Paramecium sonneborni]
MIELRRIVIVWNLENIEYQMTIKINQVRIGEIQYEINIVVKKGRE